MPSATALRIELLIIGSMASIWIILFQFGLDDIINFIQTYSTSLDKFSATVVLFIILMCYSLGAAFDGITACIEDIVFKLYETREKNTDKTIPAYNSAFMRLVYPEAYKELVNADFQLRLLRSTIFNVVLVGWAGIHRLGPNKVSYCLFISGAFIAVAWLRRNIKTKKRRENLYEAAHKLNGKESAIKMKKNYTLGVKIPRGNPRI